LGKVVEKPVGSKLKGILLIAAYLIVFTTLPYFVSSYFLSFLITLFSLVTLTSAWYILSGFAGYISLGSAAFIGIGAYVTALIYKNVPLPLCVLFSGCIAGTIGLLLGYPILRARGPYFIILTYGLAEFFRNAIQNWENLVEHLTGHVIFVGYLIPQIYLSIMIITLFITVLIFIIKNSRFGRGLVLIRENEDAAESMGVNTRLYKSLAFCLCGFFQGINGGLLALYWSYVEPFSVFSSVYSVEVIVMAYLGGPAVYGPLLGSSVLSVVHVLLWASYPYFYLILLGIILIIIVMFFSEGLSGVLRKLSKNL